MTDDFIDSTRGIRITPVVAEDLPDVRHLFEEYASSLDFRLDFQNFTEELAGLPGEYAPPHGRLLLAKCDATIAGCVALRKISKKTCEMKRLYVRPAFRRLRIGRKLTEAIIAEAVTIGYKLIRLDTVPSMVEARRMYESLGFRDISPYRHNPIPGAQFMELNLSNG